MECNCNNNNSNGGVIPWVRGNRLPLIICVYENVVTQEQVGDSTLTVNEMTRVPYTIQDNDTVTVIMKSGFRQVEMPFTTDGNKVMVTDNGELPTGAYTVEVTIERGDGARGRWQETRQVRIYENTSDAQLGEMYSIDADLFFYAKGDTGTGIADITNNPDGTLTITMTDGTSYVTDALKGDKGDKGDTGERGVSIVSFDVTGQTDVSVIYTVTFSDDTTQDIVVPKGPQGDTGLTGNGISSTTLNSDYTLTIAYTDGTTYTTPSIRGAQGAQGVSVIGFTQTGETATNTMYNLVFSDGRTQSVAIPKGTKGDKGDTGNTGAQGAQGPKGDTVTATDYTLYNVQGSDSQGAMSQDATTKAISAQTGYYTCGTAAGTPEKVVTVESGNLYKRTLGGHFKVKMTNKNTAASGVTLQIGSETAAALWYNGVAASDTNTWDAGEVISVYYDGTYYQASNAQGGGGKADLKGVDVGKNLLLQAQRLPYWPHTSTKKWTSGSASPAFKAVTSFVVPVTPGEEYYFETQGSYQVCFLQDIDDATTSGSDVNYSSYLPNAAYGNLGSGSFGYITIPVDTNYICFICNYSLSPFTRIYARKDIDDVSYLNINSCSEDVRYVEYKVLKEHCTINTRINENGTTAAADNINDLIYCPIEVAGGQDIMLNTADGVAFILYEFTDRGNMQYNCVATTSYNEDYSPRPFIITLNPSTRYVVIQTKKYHDVLTVEDVESFFRQILLPTKTNTHIELTNLGESKKEKRYTYSGEKITPWRNYFSVKYILPHLKRHPNQTGENDGRRQGCAVFKDYYFQLYQYGHCAVYDISNIDEEKLLGYFDLACYDSSNHCNTAQFAPTINSDTGFPYLYVTIGSGTRGLCVEKISVTENVWTSELVQTLTFIDGNGLHVHGDWIIGDDGYLYGCANVTNGIQYWKMECPAVTSGDLELNVENAVFTWVDDWEQTPPTWQGCMMYGGRLYHLYGTTSESREIRVFDTSTGKLVTKVNLNEAIVNREPEDLDIWRDKIIIGCIVEGTYLLEFS